MQPAHILLSFAALAGVALLPACSGGENATEPDEATANLPDATAPAQPMAAESGGEDGDATILQLEDGEPSGNSDPVMAIDDAKYSKGFAGEFIVVNVRYGGGCKDHDFAAYWDGSWMESNPPGMRIVLSHDAKDDACEAIVTETLQINIAGVTAKQRRFWAELVSGSATSDRVEVGKN